MRKSETDFISGESIVSSLKKKTRVKYNETFEYPFSLLFNKDRKLNIVSTGLTFKNDKDSISYVRVVKGVIRTIKLWSLCETVNGLHFLLEVYDLDKPKRRSDTFVNIPYTRYSVRVETDRYNKDSVKDLDNELYRLVKLCIQFGCKNDYDWISLNTETNAELINTEFFADIQKACKVDKRVNKQYKDLLNSI